MAEWIECVTPAKSAEVRRTYNPFMTDAAAVGTVPNGWFASISVYRFGNEEYATAVGQILARHLDEIEAEVAQLADLPPNATVKGA